ncbi:MAG: hypothetical protein JW863_09430 [Chitinispirillaceae bacterium]|nr:hypothetical protein [Chitinispirillaceae bacterium]
MQLKRSGKGTSLLLENRSETLVMEKFKLVEIKMDSMIFGYPVPGYLKKETACKNRYLFLKIHKDNIAALAAHTKAPLLFALAGMEAATLTMSSLSFWKYGDETLGALYSTSGVLYLSVPIVFNEDKNNSYFEAIGGSWGLTYACGLLLLGGLNFAFGDTYSRKEVFWGNIIGFNATIALSIGAGMIEMNFKRKIE